MECLITVTVVSFLLDFFKIGGAFNLSFSVAFISVYKGFI
jgi:cytochrome c oxidase subunit IV